MLNLRSKVLSLQVLAFLSATTQIPTQLKAENITTVWSQDVVAENVMNEVSRTFWVNDAYRLTTSLPGKTEWSSPCHWDSEPTANAAGDNTKNKSIVQLGNRAVDPTQLKYSNLQGMGNTRDSITATQAIQSQEEIQYYSNSKLRVSLHFQGSYDRCPSSIPSTVKGGGYSTVREFIQVTASCNQNQAGLSKNMTIWSIPAYQDWSSAESLTLDKVDYLDIDPSTCTGPLFLILKVPTSERLTIDSLVVSLNAI